MTCIELGIFTPLVVAVRTHFHPQQGTFKRKFYTFKIISINFLDLLEFLYWLSQFPTAFKTSISNQGLVFDFTPKL